MKQFLLLFLISTLSLSSFCTEYSNYGQSRTHYINSYSQPKSIKFEVNKIARYKKTKWYVNGGYQGSGSDDNSGYFKYDPDYTVYCNYGTTKVQAKVYNNSGGYEETHTWYVTINNNAPTATRKDPSSSSLSLKIGTKQKFIAKVYDADGEGNFDKVQWYVNNSLKETNNYSQLYWDNPHDDKFSYTFNNSGTYTVKAKVTDKGGKTASVSWTVNIINNAPTATRKDPASSSLSIKIGTKQKFIATVYDADGKSNFDKVQWYVNNSLEETNNYRITWSNPHDDKFSYTFDNSGTYTVTAKVTDKGGKTASVSWTVKITMPDLSVSNFKIWPDVDIESSAKLDWSYTVTNEGDMESNKCKAKFVLLDSQNNVIADILKIRNDPDYKSGIDKLVPDGVLEKNSSGTFSHEIVIPDDIISGTYYIKVIIDCDDELVGEENITNNEATFEIAVKVKYPDLIITDNIVSKATLNIGEQFETSCIVKNIGQTKARSSTLRYALSKDKNWDGDMNDIKLGRNPVEALNIDEESPEDAKLEIPDIENIEEGVWYILFVADYSNLVDEAGQTDNNIAWTQVNIVKDQPIELELSFTDIDVYDNKSMPEEPIYIEVKLHEVGSEKGIDKKVIDFEYSFNGIDNWIPISDDGISFTTNTTNSDGIANIYFIPNLSDNPVYNKNAISNVYVKAKQSTNTNIEAIKDTIKIIPTIHNQGFEIENYPIFVHEDNSNTIPVILIHGNNNEVNDETDPNNDKSYMRWNSLRNYVLKNREKFEYVDLWAWRHSTNIPIGFNGTTGNALELSEYIDLLIKNKYNNKPKKVILVTHSRGGLVARSFMAHNNNHEKVLGLITIGTPNLGSPIAIPDWTAETWNNFKFTLLPTFTNFWEWPFNKSFGIFVNTKRNKGEYTTLIYDRIGDLGLSWNNTDNSMSNKDPNRLKIWFDKPEFSSGNLVHTTGNDANIMSNAFDNTKIYSNLYKLKYGTLNQLNIKYFSQEGSELRNKLITYGAHYSKIFTTSTSETEKLKLSTSDESKSLFFLAQIMSLMECGNNVDFIANDGMVPLQSALLLDVKNGESYTNKKFINVNVNKVKIDRDFKCKSYRIYNSKHEYGIQNHLRLITPKNQDYWNDLLVDIMSFIPQGKPDTPEGETEGVLFTKTPEFKWSEYVNNNGSALKGYQLRVWSENEGRLVYETGFIENNSINHTYSPGEYLGYDDIADCEKISEELKYKNNYHWHVRYMNEYGRWSEWSNDNVDGSNYKQIIIKEYPVVYGDFTFESHNSDRDYIIVSNVDDNNDIRFEYDENVVKFHETNNYSDGMYKIWFEVLSNNNAEAAIEFDDIKLIFGEKYNNYIISVKSTQEGTSKYLNVSEDITYEYNNVKTDSIIIKTNVENWDYQVSSNSGWIKVDVDKENSKIYVQPLSYNNSDIENKAVVTITADGLEDKSVNIVQLAFSAELDVLPDNIELAKETGSVEQVKVLANFNDWKFELISSSEWLSIDRIVNDLIVSTVSKNESTSNRKGLIKVYGRNIEKNISVTQIGSDPFIDVSSNQFRVSNELNSKKEFFLLSNTNWKITYPEWLQLDKIIGVGSSTVKVSVKEICTASRQGEIIIFNSDFPSLTKTIIVTQNTAPTLLIESQSSETEENNPNGLEIFELKIINPNELNVLYSIKEDNTPFNITNGIVSVANSEQLDYEKIKKFEFTVRVEEVGNTGNSDEALVTIDLLNLNDCSPEFITESLSEAITNNEYSEFIQVVDKDYLPDDVSEITVIGELPKWIKFTNHGYYATIKGIPTVESQGDNYFTLKVTDGIKEDIKEYSIKVNHFNTSPEFITKNLKVANNTIEYYDTIALKNLDKDNLEITKEYKPNWMHIETNAKEDSIFLSGTPVFDGDGIDSLVVTVTDNIIEISIRKKYDLKVNRLPSIEMNYNEPVINKEFVINITYSDKDNDDLKLTNTNPDWMAFIDNLDGTAILKGTPINENGFEIEMSITDGYITIKETKAFCDAPTEPEVTEISSSSADIDWGDVSENSGYDLDYRKYGTSSWSHKYPTSSNYTLTGLESNTKYEYRIRTGCGSSNYSCWSVSNIFNTIANSINDIDKSNSIKIYPNPTNGTLTIESEDIEIGDIKIYDLNGRLVFNKEYKSEIDISILNEGIYLLKLYSKDEEILKTEKIVVNK